MKKMILTSLKITLISLILTSHISYALELKDLAPNTNTAVLKKDDKAPFDGVLLSKKKANEVKNGLSERDKLKEINKSLETSVSLEKDNVKQSEDKNAQLLERNDELAKDLKDSRNMSDIQKILWFGLGALGVGLVGYGAAKISK